jgi:IQ calmodulin-binding motif
VKLPPKFNQQRCSTNHLHMKLAAIYHRDRANRAATRIQRWFREFQYRQQQSRRYWLMLRGVFKFKYFLRKFRDNMDQRVKDFETLIRRSATKIQKCFRGYLVRRQYSKELGMRRIERHYMTFERKRMEMASNAQVFIAYIWRMNRIKIKLARKKREREEALKKKQASGNKKYYSYNSKTDVVITEYRGWI